VAFSLSFVGANRNKNVHLKRAPKTRYEEFFYIVDIQTKFFNYRTSGKKEGKKERKKERKKEEQEEEEDLSGTSSELYSISQVNSLRQEWSCITSHLFSTLRKEKSPYKRDTQPRFPATRNTFLPRASKPILASP